MNKVLSICLVAFLSFFSYGQPLTEKYLREYFDKTDSLNSIEGIWNIETTREFYHSDTLYDVKELPGIDEVAVIKSADGFTAFYMKGDSFHLDFTTTDVKGVYMYRNFYPLTSTYSKKQAVICTHNNMEYTYDLPDEYAIKLCGSEYEANTRVVNILKWNKIFPGKK